MGGESRYLNETQWGTAGAGVIGNTMNTSSGGTTLTSAANGATITPAGASGTTTIPAGNKVFWLQPTWSSTYASTALRRYNGGGTEVESVIGYCFSQRLLSGTSHKSAGVVANTKVALTGAAALAASAIALGVASLAI